MINDKERKYIIVVFILVAIILIFALFVIWKPLFTPNKISEITEFKSYESQEFDKLIENKFLSLAKKYIEKNNFSNTLQFIDKKYMDEHNLNSDNIYDYLNSNNLLINVDSNTIIYKSSTKTNGNRYIYTYCYTDKSNIERKIHFIEDYIGKYTISFDQESYPVLNEKTYVAEKDGLIFSIIEEKSYKESVVVNLTIQNNTNERYVFDIGSIDKVNLEMNNYYKYNLNTVIAGTQSSVIEINPGEKQSINLSFNVDLENQSTITGIEFYNVTTTDGDNTKLDIYFE